MATDSKIQINMKTGAGHDAALINLYANSGDELDILLAELTERIAGILSVKQLLQAGGIVELAIPLAAVQPEQPSATPPAVVNQHLAAHLGSNTPSAPSAGPTTETDRYGNLWTYGLLDAPSLTDGRGKYIRKDWTSAQGKTLKAWVDPAKGPKPAAAGTAEAEILWIR